MDIVFTWVSASEKQDNRNLYVYVEHHRSLCTTYKQNYAI